MLMHAPIHIILFAYAKTADGAQTGRGKFKMGNPGQFPTPQAQQDAFNKLIENMKKNKLSPMGKLDFVSECIGQKVSTFGEDKFVQFDPAVELGEMGMHAPVTMDMHVHITNGEADGVIEVSVGNRGRFLSQAELKAVYDELVAEALPDGFRLMTKREFFDQLVSDATSGLAPRVAMPGANDFEPIA